MIVEDIETRRFATRYGKIVSASMPCEDIHPLDFLAFAEGQARFLWTNPNNQHVLAGFGSAIELSSWGKERIDAIQKQVKQLFETSSHPAKPKLFGGFSFQDEFTADNAWANFAPAQFILPHYQLEQSSEGSFLSVHVEVQDDGVEQTELEEILQMQYLHLKAFKQSQTKPSELLMLRDLTEADEWADMIHKAQRFMQDDKLKKVVFARMKEAQFEAPISIINALIYLEAHYDDCYRFLFEPKSGDAFLGATPELLVSLQDDKAKSMALAASAKRGLTKDEDEELAFTLLADPKERREHRLVKEQIVQRLSKIGQVKVSETGVLKLKNIQHIYTPVEVTLEQTVTVLDLIKSLHPTPAMGGQPLNLAQSLISELEALPRGWYAAPVGFIDATMEGAFAVAIRSAVIQQERAWLFSGAGIMPGSIPEKEWQETALKFTPMLKALGIEVKKASRA